MPIRNTEARRKYEREWRKKKWAEDPEYRARKKATDLKSRRKKFEQVAAYKLEKGCSRCGFNQCARALEFHHANGDKTANVSDLTRWQKSWERIKEEIDKCEIVCANCHAIEGCTFECRAHNSAR